MGKTIYLVRHGESEWNVRRLTQGQTEHPALTPRGRRQAKRAASALAARLTPGALTTARLVSSDLRRAVETAEIVGESLGLGVVLDQRLREHGLGWLEGRSYDDTWAAAEQHDWSDPTLPVTGGESVAQVHDRLAAALADTDARAVTIMVSHADSIRAAVAYLLGHSPNQSPWLDIPNGALFSYDGLSASLTMPPAGG